MSYFQFKQFKIVQENAAMKVSTDACIQGAYFAQFLKNNPVPNSNLLDIGAGTGLLSLMLLQAFPEMQVDAIEIDQKAYIDCQYNFMQSPWSQQANVHHVALQDWSSEQKFDAIICNPPFFNNHLLTTSISRRTARHDITLSKDVLASQLVQRLHTNGVACILYPISEWTPWNDIALHHGLHLLEALSIQPSVSKDANRIIGIYSLTAMDTIQKQTLIIYNQDRSYTDSFTQLLQEYYLYL